VKKDACLLTPTLTGEIAEQLTVEFLRVAADCLQLCGAVVQAAGTRHIALERDIAQLVDTLTERRLDPRRHARQRSGGIEFAQANGHGNRIAGKFGHRATVLCAGLAALYPRARA